VQAAKNIASANDDDHLDAKLANLANLLRHILHCFGNGYRSPFPAERFTTELEQYAAVFGALGFFFHGCTVEMRRRVVTASRQDVNQHGRIATVSKTSRSRSTGLFWKRRGARPYSITRPRSRRPGSGQSGG